VARLNFRVLIVAAGCAAGSVALSTCADPSTAGRSGIGAIAFRPVFASGVNTAAAGLAIDNVRIIILRPPEDVVLDRVVTFSLDSATLRIQLSVELEAQAESLDATVELRSGALVLFSGSRRILVTQGGPPTGTPPALVLNYVGPGAQIASLLVAPRDTFLRLGDSVAYQVQALDGQGAPVSQFYVSWRTTGGPSLINGGGLLRAPTVRGNTFVVAETPTGVKDSTPVTFVPQANALVVSGGDSQSAPVLGPLPQPLVAQVRAADGLGVGGAAVQFSVITGGGQVSPMQTVSDAQGFAQTMATLGSTPGTHTFRASVTGVPPVTFTATATAGPATQISANSPLDQSATVATAVAAPPSVLVQDALGNPVSGFSVTFVVTSGGGAVVPTTPVPTNAQGVAQTTSWTLGPSPGPNALEAQAAGLTGSPVQFTATGLAGGSGRLGFAVAPPATAQASQALSPAPVIQVQDAGGNPVSQAGVNVTATLASGGGALTGSTTSVTDAAGQATFANLRISGLVGPRTLTFSATGLTSLTSGVIDLVPGAAAQLTIETQPPATATSGAALTPQPIVRMRDVDGNPVSQAGTAVTAVIASSPGGSPSLANATATTDAVGSAAFSGLAVTGLPGDYTLRFDATGLASATSDTITLGAGAATSLAIITQPSSSAQAGVQFTQQPVVELRDAAGSPVNQAGVSIAASFASSPGGTPTLTNPTATTVANGRATFSGLGIAGVVGNYTLRFNATGLTPVVSGTVVLSVGPVSPSVSQLSATPAAMDADSVAFATVSVTARDAGGNVISGAAVVLSVSGSGNLITQPPPTSPSGFTQGGFVTFVPGQKIVSATINTVAIDQRDTVTANAPPQIVFNGDSLGLFPSGILRVNGVGTGRALITPEGPFGDIRARFSPNRSRITYAATPGFPNPNQLHVASISPVAIAHLTTPTDTGARQPRYNPTGQHLAFQVGDEFNSDQDVVVIANVNTATISELDGAFGRLPTVFITDGSLANFSGSGAFAWDPQMPNRLAFVRDLTPFGQSGIFTANFDGTGLVGGQVLNDGVDSIRVREMDWSPDGSFIVFSADVLPGGQQALFRIDRDLSLQSFKRITTPPTSPQFVEDTRPVVSPDGTEILFLRSSIQFEGSLWNWFIVPSGGTEANVVQVSNEAASFQSHTDLTADWSPDGSRIVLVGTDGTDTGVFVVPRTTRAATYFTERVKVSSAVGSRQRSDVQPSWRP